MESTLRRAWAEISLDNLTYNYNRIRQHIGPKVKFLGVVKADAYGHGSVQVAEKLQSLGADYLAVSSIDEAMELRINGITMPILILGHTPVEQVDRLICFNITQTVSCEAKAEEYSSAAQRCSGTLKIHIKVDTGMSRLGYICEGGYFEHGVDGIVHACSLPGLDAEGIFTHFSMADEDDEESIAYTDHQFKLFNRVIEEAEAKLDRTFPIRHCANTGATATSPEKHLDMVRPAFCCHGYGEHAVARVEAGHVDEDHCQHHKDLPRRNQGQLRRHLHHPRHHAHRRRALRLRRRVHALPLEQLQPDDRRRDRACSRTDLHGHGHDRPHRQTPRRRRQRD